MVAVVVFDDTTSFFCFGNINAFGSAFVLDGMDSESDEADEEHADHTHESDVAAGASAPHHTAVSCKPTVKSVEVPRRLKIPLSVLSLQLSHTTKSKRGKTWPMLWQVLYFRSGGLRDIGLVLSGQCLVCKGKRGFHTSAVTKYDSGTDPHDKCSLPLLLSLFTCPS